MFRFHTTNDLISEISKEIDRSKFAAQIVVDEMDLFFLNDSLLRNIDRISLEIIIISNSNKKSLKVINLVKRLVDCQAEVHWFNNNLLYVNESFFAIFDKFYLLDKELSETNMIAEELVREKLSLFDSFKLQSHKMELLSGDIDINFESSKHVIYKHESISLKWDINNAHYAKLFPEEIELPLKGSLEFTPLKDVTYKIEAKNNTTLSKKKIFIRVLEPTDIVLKLEAFDPIIKEFIEIESSNYNIGHYGVYFGQDIKISWHINMIGKFNEKTLGNLPLQGEHNFTIEENVSFCFKFNSIISNQTKKINLHTFNDIEIFNKLNPEDEILSTRTEIKRKSIIQNINLFLKKIFKTKWISN